MAMKMKSTHADSEIRSFPYRTRHIGVWKFNCRRLQLATRRGI